MERAAVVGMLARIARKRPVDIADQASLASLGLSSSLGLSLLRSSLEAAAGKAVAAFDGRTRVAELVSLLANGSMPPDAGRAAPPITAAEVASFPAGSAARVPWGGVGLGLDIQDIESMPLTSDFRSHEFYRDHFVPTEIATAVLRAEPRVHLCGIFCAKEAAKKSHPALLGARMNTLVVTHDPAGKPSLGLTDRALTPYAFQFIVSISHTDKFAAAACLTIASGPGAADGSLSGR